MRYMLEQTLNLEYYYYYFIIVILILIIIIITKVLITVALSCKHFWGTLLQHRDKITEATIQSVSKQTGDSQQA
jgi:predicted Holliday junction resolvase-like endonuclease